MKIIVVRHGETDMNKEDRLQGSRGTDLSLNANGKRVVAALRDSMLLVPSVIYASSRARTKETAQILNERFGVEIITEDAIIERDFGTLTGASRKEIDPEILLADLEGRYDYRPYGGESIEDVTRRVTGFLRDLTIEHGDALPLLVTHRGVIRILYDLYPPAGLAADITPGSMHLFTI